MRQTIDSLEREGIKYEIFDNVRVEPNDKRCARDWTSTLLEKKRDAQHPFSFLSLALVLVTIAIAAGQRLSRLRAPTTFRTVSVADIRTLEILDVSWYAR